MKRADIWMAKGLVLCALAGVFFSGVLTQVIGWLNGQALAVSTWATGPGPRVDEELRHGAVVRWGDRWTYEVPEPTVLQRLGALLAPAVITVLLAVAAVALWRLLDRIASGDPFERDVLTTFRVLSVVVAVGAIAVPLIGFAGRMLVIWPIQEHPYVVDRLDPTELGLMLAGIAFAGFLELLGHVFRRGAELRADTEGLI